MTRLRWALKAERISNREPRVSVLVYVLAVLASRESFRKYAPFLVPRTPNINIHQQRLVLIDALGVRTRNTLLYSIAARLCKAHSYPVYCTLFSSPPVPARKQAPKNRKTQRRGALGFMEECFLANVDTQSIHSLAKPAQQEQQRQQKLQGKPKPDCVGWNLI
ncbi:hypothetical protein DFP73DRAFT_608836 [Morchella snyderi]|nr:hypothetical protein DFP73DRAFT_608836 [Morchella snyderi]